MTYIVTTRYGRPVPGSLKAHLSDLECFEVKELVVGDVPAETAVLHGSGEFIADGLNNMLPTQVTEHCMVDTGVTDLAI
jgi:hypothetical protein